jgi:hypothetical protein
VAVLTVEYCAPLLSTVTQHHQPQQADNLYTDLLNDPRLALFDQPEIVGGFAWRATAWQADQEVLPKDYGPKAPYVPPDMTHPAVGHHQKLNEYLTNYIQERKLLA